MLKKLVTLFLIFFGLNSNQKSFSKDELIGKSNVVFYGEDYKLQKDAYDAFLKMQSAAEKDSINIKIVSSYRSFEHQKRIWTRKYKRFTADGLTPTQSIRKIIEYSTIPGTSRHHWGTDIDIIDGNKAEPKDVLIATNFTKNAVYEKLKNWMDENANRYGFYLVYTNESSRKGFNYEPWHYSYKPISKPMLKAYLKIDIQKLLKSEKLVGSNFFTEEFISKYIREHVKGINQELEE